MTSETSPSLLPYRRGWSSEAAPHRHPSAVPTFEGPPHVSSDPESAPVDPTDVPVGRPVPAGTALDSRRVGRPDPFHREREAAMTLGENMQIRTLGKTGLQATELCVGTS